jgi:hypothetical protein
LAVKTLVIGRSPFADVVLADASVASHHAELVVTDDGRLHVTDCAGGTGTWRGDVTEGSEDGGWIAIRQAFIGPEEPLRLGDHLCTARDLLRAAREPVAIHGAAVQPRPEGGGGGRIMRPRGRVERDPRTGEIIHRRP